jgi:hypothetical protein
MKKMKCIPAVLVVICLVTFSTSGYAQSHMGRGEISPVQVGSTVFNLGIGVGADYKGDSYGTGFGFKASAEWGLWQAGPGVITLGPEIGGSFSNGGSQYLDYRASTIVVAARAAWHFGWQVPGLDTYGGFSGGMGFHHRSKNSEVNNNYNQVIPAFGAFVGASYFISPQFGFNAEAGFDITNFQVGVVFKLQ